MCMARYVLIRTNHSVLYYRFRKKYFFLNFNNEEFSYCDSSSINNKVGHQFKGE